MLEKRHCKATVVRSEVCTPAFAAKSVRQFMQQEVELAADVQRNLTAAVAALEELEQHRQSGLKPTAVQEGHTQRHPAPGSGDAGAQAALACKALPHITNPALIADTQPPQSLKSSKAKKDKSHRKDRKRKAQAGEQL